jgi:hypothetical protein
VDLLRSTHPTPFISLSIFQFRTPHSTFHLFSPGPYPLIPLSPHPLIYFFIPHSAFRTPHFAWSPLDGGSASLDPPYSFYFLISFSIPHSAFGTPHFTYSPHLLISLSWPRSPDRIERRESVPRSRDGRCLRYRSPLSRSQKHSPPPWHP